MDVLTFIITLVGGGLGGSVLSQGVTRYKGRLQTMRCYYIEDDVLSKVPQKDENNEVHNNLYCKRFRLKNTTNQDIQEFKVLFQFDPGSIVTSCYSKSKEGYDKQRIKRSASDANVAEALVRQFNRGDEIEYTIQVANVTDNAYYVSESKCIGFKIKCYDRRSKTAKSKSKQSNQVLVVRH